MPQDRRTVLTFVAVAPVAMLAAAPPKPKQATSCYDPNTLALAMKNRRRSLGFAEASADPKKRCGSCAFFVAGKGACGTCQLLSGGPVTANGLCNSYASKPV